MSNGPRVDQSQNTYSQTRAPGFLQSPLQNAALASNAAFGQGIEGFNQTAGRNLIGQQLRGDFLMPESNPFLQGTFNRAADLTRGRLDTEFAGSGRNLGASQPARSEELQTLASNIFGGNFARERGLQQGALSQVSQFDPINQLIQRIGLLAPAAGRDVSTQSSGQTEEHAAPLDRALAAIGAFF